jgi:hypothetical protein
MWPLLLTYPTKILYAFLILPHMLHIPLTAHYLI